MTTIAVPQETFDAMRGALEAMEARFGSKSFRAKEQPQTFACEHTDETCHACEGLVSGWKAVQAAIAALAAANAVEPQAQGESRSLTLAKQQWESWKRYALEVQERLVKYEGGASMVLNAAHPQAPEPPKIEAYAFRWNGCRICYPEYSYDQVLDDWRSHVDEGYGKIVGLVAVEVDEKGNPV